MNHWSRHARQWAQVGAPLRPSGEDVGFVEDEIAAWARAHGRAPRALLLGVTPELATARWPDGTRLLAVDRQRAMIDALFARGPGRDVVAGDWCALPRRAGSVDLVLADGCLSCLAFPAG